jgi:hypothetical protein
MMELNVYTSPERGKFPYYFALESTNNCSDGNIRYFEYENDKFEFLSEYKSGDPQRGLAFMPRRGINVSLKITSNAQR